MEDRLINDIDIVENIVDEYVPEDPNAPVDDFEIAEIEIEDSMPEDLKKAIRKYNEVHSRIVSDLMEPDDDFDDDSLDNETNISDSEILEDNDIEIDFKNIF